MRGYGVGGGGVMYGGEGFLTICEGETVDEGIRGGGGV